jgi:glucoamylase
MLRGWCLAALAAGLLLLLAVAAPAWAASGTAPGAPGTAPNWTPANKDGFGTATAPASKVWHTLSNGELTEVYYPDLGTPSVRDLQFIVSGDKTFAERETDATTHVTELADAKSLTYRQVNTAKSGQYRITKTYVEDPGRSSLLVNVKFESLTGKGLSLYVLYDPSLTNDGSDDSGTTSGATLLAPTGRRRAHLPPRPASRPRRTATWAPATAGPTYGTTSRWTGATRRRRTGTSCRRRRRR